MRNLKSVLCVVTPLLLGVVPLTAQGITETPVREILNQYVTEMATPPLYRSETGGLILEMITGRQIRLTESRREALLVELERIVLDGSIREDTRADAVGLVALAGERGISRRRAGTANRLATLYHRTDSELVRRQIISALPRLEERPTATAFLATIVEKPTESFPEESWTAVRALLAAGEDGTATLRRIHRVGSARNPAARSLVARYVADDFRHRQ